jgi:hypothetical protein
VCLHLWQRPELRLGQVRVKKRVQVQEPDWLPVQAQAWEQQLRVHGARR